MRVDDAVDNFWQALPGGEDLGRFELKVQEVAENIEMADAFELTGVKTSAQVFARLKFTFMS